MYLDYFGVSKVSVVYDDFNCTQYKNTTTLSKLDITQEAKFLSPGNLETLTYEVGNCSLNQSISCFTHEDFNCRNSVRMSALLTLTACLVIKATYMIVTNVSLRRSVKSQCLTFGDVIVASAMNRDTRIYNECMVNAGDASRHRTVHTCHKHCKDREPSATGDSIGHCQACKGKNVTDKAADLLHPSVATKYKKSLISSLGTTALVQMIILMSCSIAMLAVSLLLAIHFGHAVVSLKSDCKKYGKNSTECTRPGEVQYLKLNFGTFGGFNSGATIEGMDGLTNELVAFLIANGAQVLYSALYLLLTYNVTLISMESDWGELERTRRRLRCTLVKGSGFAQSYWLQLPKKVLYPMMVFSAVVHWLLGLAISAQETVYTDGNTIQHSETSLYSVSHICILRGTLR